MVQAANETISGALDDDFPLYICGRVQDAEQHE